MCMYIHVYIHMNSGILAPAPKRMKNLSFAVSWMDSEVIMLNEMSDNK